MEGVGPAGSGPWGPPAWLTGAVGATCQGVMDFLVRPAGSLCTVREHAFLRGPQPISEIRCALLFVTRLVSHYPLSRDLSS